MSNAGDQLRGGPDREPRRVPRWVQALAAVAVASVVAVLAGHGYGRPAGEPAAQSTPRSSVHDRPEGTFSPAEGQVAEKAAGPLAVGAVCTHTDGTRHLQVQFQVINAGLGRVTVVAVRPFLPIGGLRPRAVVMPRSPSCGTPAARTGASAVLEPGERVGVQLSFLLPPACPVPYPVQADVDLLVVGESPGTQRLALLSDLGGFHFASCDPAGQTTQTAETARSAQSAR